MARLVLVTGKLIQSWYCEYCGNATICVETFSGFMKVIFIQSMDCSSGSGNQLQRGISVFKKV